MSAQWDFTAPFEGKVDHLYKDTAGYITAGVGFMFPNLRAAQLLPWSPSRDIALDWAAVEKAPAGHAAAFYRGMTRARLSEDAMRAEFDGRAADFEKRTRLLFTGFLSYPEPVRVALVDMAFNLGIAGLGKYAKLRGSCNSRDWTTAAEECHRFGISAARNEATKNLFLEAV